MRLGRVLMASIGFSLVAGGASAGDAEFAITAEFLDVCSEKSAKLEAVNKQFADLGWDVNNGEIGEVLIPDDFLKKVKHYQAHEVELENGASWYGGVAQGKMGGQKLGYCSVIAIDSEPSGYREDFELAAGQTSPKVVTIPLSSGDDHKEVRAVYQSNDSLYVMREIWSGEAGLFYYIRLFGIEK